MECMNDCNCGAGCQNQRFQKKEYADVSVIKTEKKGFGLRANAVLEANDFIFEYIGEVINEPTFRRRMLQYDQEGIKHFYFMSLNKGEFVDATKKGNLGRFCNHSCNPNCYVDKWIVGDKVRMGIFAGRKISVGEELVFNYNVDRYGADPQPCYCGEPNCTGYIGGKTQTERATKLPVATIEALGIEDGDSWDTAVAKKPRKKKVTEDDEDYVNSVQARGLDEAGVTKVMPALMQCKEKWIAVKLLERIQNAEDDRVRHQVVRMHGYQILKTTLETFKDDTNVVLQILDVLYQLPRLTKNKITEAKIEGPIQSLTSSENEEVAAGAKRLLDVWSKLETAYRIPRQKADSHAPAVNAFDERRNMRREAETAKPDPFANVVIPKGPRSNVPQRSAPFFGGAPRPRKVPPSNIPAGWYIATDPSGAYYFYNKKGETTWRKPTEPAVEVATVPSKVQDKEKALQDIINNLTKDPTPRQSATHTPQRGNTPAQETKQEKWRSLPIEKQMRIYENTVRWLLWCQPVRLLLIQTQISPHVSHVMNKFRHKLPKDELKRLAKEISKKLVASDYKNKRVKDPTTMSEDKARGVKNYVKGFFDRAVVKHREHEKRKAERDAQTIAQAPPDALAEPAASEGLPAQVDDEVILTDVEDEDASVDSAERKRKRDGEEAGSANQTPSDTPSLKRVKEEDAVTPPPPPPPPPATDTPTMEMTEEERFMKEQEEALMRENEEAERLEEAEQSKLREQVSVLEQRNEEARRDNAVHEELTGEEKPRTNGNHERMEIDESKDSMDSQQEGRTRQVLSH